MATAFDSTAFERGLDPILRVLTPDQVQALIRFRGDETIEPRIEQLSARSNEGELTQAERAEYEGYLRATSSLPFFRPKPAVVWRARDAWMLPRANSFACEPGIAVNIAV